LKDYSKIGSTPVWSIEEIDILKRVYPRIGTRLRELLPNRTMGAIMRKASELGLKDPRFWNQYEIDLLKEKYPLLGINIPDLKRTHTSIHTKAHKLRIKCKNDGRVKKGQRLSPETEFGRVHPSKYIKKPTRPEKRLMKIIEKYKLPVRYVGCGEFIIGDVNPDFIAINGRRKVVEIFSDYWHGRTPRFTPRDWRRTEHGRREYFHQFGYESLILWTSELEGMIEDEVVSQLKSFLGE